MRKLSQKEPLHEGLDQTTTILIAAVKDLSLCKSMNEITAVVRKAARALARSDGATFILKEDDLCFYADEDAIGPLWKGRKFPMPMCISGWSMIHKKQVTIEDIYVDTRIPIDAYRPTFVKSLAMTPIRQSQPVGAIGTYWAKQYKPSIYELEALQALADATSIAIENVSVLLELEARVHALEKANHQISRMTWMASHDLKEPLRSIGLSLELLVQEFDESLEQKSKKIISRMKRSTHQAQQLIKDLLEVVQAQQHKVELEEVDLNLVAQNILSYFSLQIEEKCAEVIVEELPKISTDKKVVERKFHNLISNALKFHKNELTPKIHILLNADESSWLIGIKDNGLGVSQEYHKKVFDLFSRIHNKEIYPGSGLGLAICKECAESLGGEIKIESKEGVGSTFWLSLPKSYK